MRVLGTMLMGAVLLGGPVAAQTTQTYVYDVHGRVTGAAQARTAGATWAGYAYDGADSRSARQATALSSLSAANMLYSGEQLVLQQVLTSSDARMKLVLQVDGNLVVSFGATPLWGSGSSGSQALFLAMQTDGNLVLYGANYAPLWYSGTNGHPGAYLVMQSDGNLVIYAGSTPIWATNTGGH